MNSIIVIIIVIIILFLLWKLFFKEKSIEGHDSGALIQLVAKDVQDSYLTGDAWKYYPYYYPYYNPDYYPYDYATYYPNYYYYPPSLSSLYYGNPTFY